jgi:predicted Zn-dependent peptidase
MPFKGTSRLSALDIAKTFDELGGKLNAATSRETTTVYARVLDASREIGVDVVAAMVHGQSAAGAGALRRRG